MERGEQIQTAPPSEEIEIKQTCTKKSKLEREDRTSEEGQQMPKPKGRGANTDGGAARANAWMLLGLFDFGISNPLETKAWSNLYSTNQI